MGMFLGQVEGPDSEQSFARGFIERVQPTLKDRAITAAAWVGDDQGYYIHGFTNAEIPVSGISNLVEAVGWRLRLQTFRNIINLPSYRVSVLKCDMPYNRHPMGNSAHKSCTGGHDIAIDHQVDNCPACGLTLR